MPQSICPKCKKSISVQPSQPKTSCRHCGRRFKTSLFTQRTKGDPAPKAASGRNKGLAIAVAVVAIGGGLALGYPGVFGCKSEAPKATVTPPAKTAPANATPEVKNASAQKAVPPAAAKSTPPKTGGSTLNPGLVQMMVRLNLPQLDACYQAGLKKNKDLKGNIQMHMTVGLGGAMAKADVETRELRDLEVLQCIKAELMKWKFARTGTDPIHVMYPISFPLPKPETKGKGGFRVQ